MWGAGSDIIVTCLPRQTGQQTPCGNGLFGQAALGSSCISAGEGKGGKADSAFTCSGENTHMAAQLYFKELMEINFLKSGLRAIASYCIHQAY